MSVHAGGVGWQARWTTYAAPVHAARAPCLTAALPVEPELLSEPAPAPLREPERAGGAHWNEASSIDEPARRRAAQRAGNVWAALAPVNEAEADRRHIGARQREPQGVRAESRK
jgi:hypothetical protein